MRSKTRKIMLGAAVSVFACALFALAACSTTSGGSGPVNVVSEINFEFENGDGQMVTTLTRDAQGNVTQEVGKVTIASTETTTTTNYTYNNEGDLTGYTLTDGQGDAVTFTGSTEIQGNVPGQRTVTQNLAIEGDDSDSTLSYIYDIATNDTVSKYESVATVADTTADVTTTYDEYGRPTSYVVSTGNATTIDLSFAYEDTEAQQLILVTNNTAGSATEGQTFTGVLTFEDEKLMQMDFDFDLGTTITVSYTYQTIDNPAALVRSTAPAEPYDDTVLNLIANYVVTF